MKKIYLDYANGLYQSGVVGKYKPSTESLKFIKKKLVKIMGLKDKEFISLSQNLSTSLIYVLRKVFQRPKFNVYISSHEIKYLETILTSGVMPKDKVSYPNYAKFIEVAGFSKDIHVFEPDELLRLPEEEDKIIIISHVSRMTGEILIKPNTFLQAKKKNSNDIIIVDGCQSVGALEVNSDKVSDVYLGVNSKFLGAIPHIGFCWISNKIVNSWKIKEWTIDHNDFQKEISSTRTSLEKISLQLNKVLILRNIFENNLLENGIEFQKLKNQVNYILIIPIKSEELNQLVQELKKSNIFVSSNTNWSIREPEIPGIRISIGKNNSIQDIKNFIAIFKKIRRYT